MNRFRLFDFSTLFLMSVSMTAKASTPVTPIPSFPITFQGKVIPHIGPVPADQIFPGHIEVYLLNPKNPLALPIPCDIKSNSYPVKSPGDFSFTIKTCSAANKLGYNVLSLHYFSDANQQWSLADAIVDASIISGSSVRLGMNYASTQIGSSIMKNCVTTSKTYADGFVYVYGILSSNTPPYSYDQITSLSDADALSVLNGPFGVNLAKVCK